MGSTPKPPKQTPAEKAFETEQRRSLNKEIIEENRRRKALSRGQVGAVTLLSGLPSDGSAPVADGGAAAPGVNTGTRKKTGVKAGGIL